MTDWTGFLRIRLKGSLYHGPTTRIPFFKFSAPLQRGRAKRGGEDDKKQASVSVFSEGLQSVDSHLAGRRFIFFLSIKQCLHYRLPPPLSFRALFNSGGAWPKLRTDQRCKIKRFQHVYFMLSLMEGLRDAFHRGIKRTFLNCKNQTLTHKQRIYILYPWHPANVWKGFQTPHCVCVCVGENAQAF